MKQKYSPDEPLRCSFCHKTQEQVEKLISSPSDYPRAYICNECVSVCETILEDEKREQATALHRRLCPYRRLQLRVRDRLPTSFHEHERIVEAIISIALGRTGAY